MLSAAENEILCRIEGDAPMGRLMRRHWVPALLSEQVSRPDDAPVRVQLFGEKLVAFPRQQRKARPARRVLSTSQGIARVRTQRRVRPALSLPRLEVRHRG